MIIRISPWVLMLAFFSNSLLAETYTREYTYNALQEDSKLTSRIINVSQNCNARERGVATASWITIYEGPGSREGAY